MHICTTHWYEILVQPKYIDYFSDSAQGFANAANGHEVYAPLFEEFRSIVSGLTLACAIGTHVPDNFLNTLAGKNLYEYLGYRYFLDTCPDGQQRFEVVWQSIRRPYTIDLAELSAEQIAVLILYPFWSRMNGGFEIEFAQSGRLGRYLRALQEKLQEEGEVNNHGSAAE